MESTLSGKTYIRIFERALSSGYELELHYLWLSDVAQAIARVRRRVRMGGHNVPSTDIRRRFKRSLTHLIDDYLPLATRWAIWDNRGLLAKRLATSACDDVDSARELIGLRKRPEQGMAEKNRRLLSHASSAHSVVSCAHFARRIANLACPLLSGQTENPSPNKRTLLADDI